MDISGVFRSFQQFCQKVHTFSGEGEYFSSARNRFSSTLSSMSSCCEGKEKTSIFDCLKAKSTQAVIWVSKELSPFFRGIPSLRSLISSPFRQSQTRQQCADAEVLVFRHLEWFKTLTIKCTLSYAGENYQNEMDFGEIGESSKEGVNNYFHGLQAMVSGKVQTTWETREAPLTDILLEITAYGEHLHGSELAHYYIPFNASILEASDWRQIVKPQEGVVIGLNRTGLEELLNVRRSPQ